MSAGYTLYSHFCMDRLVDTSLTSTKNSSEMKACGLCTDENDNSAGTKKSGCCKEVAKVVKVDASHQPSGFSFKALDPLALIPAAPLFSFEAPLSIRPVLVDVRSNAPPPFINPALYLQHCTFLI